MSLFHPQSTPPAADALGASRRRVARNVLLAATAAAVGLGVVTTAASPAAADATSPAGHTAASSRVAVQDVTPAAQRAALAQWTPARMSAARNADLAPQIKAKVTPATAAQARPDGPAGRAAGTAPVGAEPTPVGATPSTYQVGVPFSSYSSYPYSMNGKVFFSNSSGSWQCSGTSVTAYYNNVQQSEVWTAGHCVANSEGTHPNTWNTSTVFIPGYNANYPVGDSRREPFGEFAATQLSTSSGWFGAGDPTVDLGAFKVGTSTTGRTLYSAVGTAGFMWNANATQTFDMFGYPAVSPYNGTAMWQYRGTTSSRQAVSGQRGQSMVGVPNPMTGGSSGGAWYVGWATNSSGWINGHNDWKWDSSTMYSPYFDSLANTVRCFGGSSC